MTGEMQKKLCSYIDIRLWKHYRHVDYISTDDRKGLRNYIKIYGSNGLYIPSSLLFVLNLMFFTSCCIPVISAFDIAPLNQELKLKDTGMYSQPDHHFFLRLPDGIKI
jgi:hypothetical protein